MKNLIFTSFLALFFSFTMLAQSGESVRQKVSAKITGNLAKQDYEKVRGDFNDELSRNLSAAQIQEVWKGVLKQLGSYKQQDSPESSVRNGYHVVTTKMNFQNGAAYVDVVFDAGNKVYGLWIHP